MNKIIKISIKFITSLIIFFIVSLLGIYLLLAISGLNLENINLGNIHIGKLYIKIDKKVIISANNIKILTKKSNTATNYSEINKIIKNNFIYLNYLQKVSLKNIQINENIINFLNFYNNQLELDTNLAYLKASFIPKNRRIDFLINRVSYKPMNITLNNIKGYETANLFKLNLFAKYKYQNSLVSLNLNIGKSPKYKLNIENLNNNLINNFTPILKENNITLTSKNLIVNGDEKNLNFNIDNSTLKDDNYNLSATISNLNGKYSIENGKFNVNIKKPFINFAKNSLNSENFTINGDKKIVNFTINNSLINYNDYNLSATIPNLNGKYSIEFNELKADADKLLLKQTNIKKWNRITVNNLNLLFSENRLFIKLFSHTRLDTNLVKLLKKFNLSIPIYQKNGINDEEINLVYNLKNGKLDTNLKAKILNSQLMITKNDYLTLKKVNLELNNSLITLQDSYLNYKKAIADLDYFIKNGIIDLNKSLITTNGKIETLKLQNLGEIKNFDENTTIDLKTLSIYLKHLQINIFIKDKTTIEINRLSILRPYIKYLQDYNILYGKVKINIGNKININTAITKTNQQILEKNLLPMKKIDLTTIINGDKILVKNSNFKFDILNKTPIMKIKGGLKNIDLNITKFVNNALKEKNETKKVTTKTTKKETNKTDYIVDIDGLNNNIIYENHQLYSHKLKIHYDKNFTKISSLNNDRNITLIQKNNQLKIYGLNLRNKDLKELSNITFIKNAKLNFFALETNQSSAMYGFIHINRGYIKELKAFNNVIAFINLIPSLVTFHGAGFSDKGFKIRDGHIDYIYDKGILYIKKGYLKGDNLEFKFQGYIDVVKKKIKMNVDVVIVVKLVKDIPIVNYIILGKDNGITLKLLVEGDLDNPKVKKNLTKQLIGAPFGIIQRTIMTPFRIFMKK